VIKVTLQRQAVICSLAVEAVADTLQRPPEQTCLLALSGKSAVSDAQHAMTCPMRSRRTLDALNTERYLQGA